MKLRTEMTDGEEEVIIRYRERDEKIASLQRIIENILEQDGDIILTLNGNEHYIPKKDILFFETDGGRIAAHTRENMFYASGTLQSIESKLPNSFIRASKSCIVNAREVCALSKNFTGLGEILFKKCSKRTFVSRGYYKELKQKIYELHDLEN